MIRALAVGLALLAGTWVGAGTASAHNALVSAEPANGASIAAGPQQVRLTFDQPVERGFTVVTVTGPGNTRWESGEPAISGNSVTASVLPLGPAGEYLIGYRIVSADGHPVSGSVRFQLTTAGNGTPAANPPPNPGAADDAGSGMPVWPWIAGAVLLLGAGMLIAFRLGRRPAG